MIALFSPFVGGNTAFAFELYTYLKQEEGNFFFFPRSISTALAMTYAGARENTAAQMADVLHFTLKQEQLTHASAECEAQSKVIQKKPEEYLILQKKKKIIKELT